MSIKTSGTVRSVRLTRACTVCGRKALAGSNRCGKHPGKRGYDSPHWQAVRRRRLQLDMQTCQLRLEGCKIRATTVHLDPACGGDHLLATVENTTSACSHCHGVVDAPRASLHVEDDDGSD